MSRSIIIIDITDEEVIERLQTVSGASLLRYDPAEGYVLAVAEDSLVPRLKGIQGVTKVETAAVVTR